MALCFCHEVKQFFSLFLFFTCFPCYRQSEKKVNFHIQYNLKKNNRTTEKENYMFKRKEAE